MDLVEKKAFNDLKIHNQKLAQKYLVDEENILKLDNNLLQSNENLLKLNKNLFNLIRNLLKT